MVSLTRKLSKLLRPASSAGDQGNFSPLRYLVIIMGGIFMAEVVAMIILVNYKALPYYLQVLLDASIMIVLISPLIYFLSLRPLLLHIRRTPTGREATS